MRPSAESTVEWARVRVLFEQAVSLDRAARAQFLGSACPDESKLRAEVERLLEEHDRESRLLATPPLDPRPTFEPLTLVAGRFEVIRLLGAGGMGEVYEARDRVLGECVALKRVRPDLVYDARIRERFKREILSGRRVTHPNVCRIYDVVQDPSLEPGLLAFTMELIAGETLAQLLKREGRLPPDRALALALQMAAGLAALHEHNIVHRDFKPANVMLVDQAGPERTVKITDFGLARQNLAADSPGLLSGSHDIIGTPTYMAPEQLKGEAGKVGPATDVYALGLVLYELVTGERPFPAETLGDNVVQKTARRPRPPRERAPDLSETWNATILRCLEKEPEDRPQSPQAVAAALEGRSKLPPKPLAVKRWAVRAAAALIIVIFLALAGAWLRQVETERRPQTVAVLPFDVFGGGAELPAFADGLMATITRRLTQFEGMNENLVVMAPSTVLSRGVADPETAAKRLGVNYAVEGGLQTSGDQLVLTLTLVDAHEGHQLYTEMVTGSRDNALALQDGAVRRLANMLNLRIQPEHLDTAAGLDPVALGAAQFYTAGLGYLQRSDVTANIDNAITQFQRAIDLDRGYAEAHAGVAEAYWRLFVRTKENDRLDRSRESVRAALQLNNQLPEAHITMGHILSGTGSPEQAILEFEKALALSPRNGDAFEGLAEAYGQLGRFGEALATHDKAVQLRRSDWKAHHQLGAFFFKRRMYEEAIEPFQRVIELTPDNALGLANLGAALHGAGRLEEARKRYEESIQIEPIPAALSNLGKMHYDEGRYEKAATLFERAVAARPNSYQSRANLASAYDVLDDPRARHEYLQAAEIAMAALSRNSLREDLYSNIAFYFAGAGDKGVAEKWLAKALEKEPKDSMEAARNAATLAKLGRTEEACHTAASARRMGHTLEKLAEFRWLERILEEPGCRPLLANAA